MRPLTTALVLPFLTLGLGLAQEHKPELNDQERQAILAQYDRNHDGTLDDGEKAKAMGKLDKDGDGLIAGKEADQVRAKARALLLKSWWKAVGDEDQTTTKGPNDQVRVKTTHTLRCGSTYCAYVLVRWGDLENGITTGGKDSYSNWDGALKVDGGTAREVKELAFDDQSHREPKAGSGADKLTKDHDQAAVTWKSGVVGATDGLLIEISLPAATGSATLDLGGILVPLIFTPVASGTVLPDGRTVN